jgi:hypothetical protein
MKRTEYFRLSSDFFVWTGNVGVCDVTDLPPEAPFHKAVEEPFDVASSKTGVVKTFVLFASIRDVDDDLIGWQYCSEDGDFTIIIDND